MVPNDFSVTPLQCASQQHFELSINVRCLICQFSRFVPVCPRLFPLSFAPLLLLHSMYKIKGHKSCDASQRSHNLTTACLQCYSSAHGILARSFDAAFDVFSFCLVGLRNPNTCLSAQLPDVNLFMCILPLC